MSKNNKAPLTYAIVLNWNGWKDTLECLTGLRKIGRSDLRVLVLDNGSSDDSVGKIKSFVHKEKFICNGTNLGFAAGCNVGIKLALFEGADYIWLINNDTLPKSDSFSNLIAYLDDHPNAGAVGSILRYYDPPFLIQAWGGGRLSLMSGQTWHLKIKAQPDFISGASMFLRAEALRKVGLLDERFFMYWEDVDISLRLKDAGWELGVAEDSVVLHKESAATGVRSIAATKYLDKSGSRFLKKHASMPRIALWYGFLGRVLKRLVRGEFRLMLIALLYWETNTNDSSDP